MQLRDAVGDALDLILMLTFFWLAECKMLWRVGGVCVMSLYAITFCVSLEGA